MKLKFAFAIIILAGLMGCNENKTENHNHSQEQDSVTHAHSEAPSQKLVLNDEKKWKLDDATKNNINSIRQTVQNVSSSAQKDYDKAAFDLENEANQLVSQCKMSGKDHDMLHLWLEDFLTSLKELKNSSQKEQPIAFEKIEKHVNEFSDYFE
jgi:hypothetical protein